MFYKNFASNYHKIFPLKQPKKDFLLKHLKKEKILEVGCSIGELSHFLSLNNLIVNAIDLDSINIEVAKEKYAENKSLSFEIMDMLKIENNFEKYYFDSIVCLGNVIVHLDSISEIEKFFKYSFNLLKNKGVFIGQIVNYDRIFNKSIKSFPTIETNEFSFEREYDLQIYSPYIKFTVKYRDKINEKISTNSVKLLPAKFEEINRILNNCGFNLIEYYGDFKGSKFKKGSPALIFVAYKN